MIIDIEQNKFKKELNISYYDENGKIKIKKVPIPESELFSWKECKSTDKMAHPKIKAWNGSFVKKQKTKSLSKHRIYEFLTQLPEEDTKELYSLNYPSVGFIDIETRIPDFGFESFDQYSAETPEPILTIAVVSQKGTAIVLGTKPLTLKEETEIELKLKNQFSELGYECKFKYLYFPNELEMLHTFFIKIVPSFGLITGWNFIKFDWTYLFNRYVKLGGDPSVASPTNSLNYKQTYPSHVAIFDYASIFARLDRSIKVKENNTLDFVSKSVLNVNKVSYSGSLNDLYEDDFPRYVWYNVVDSILVHLIDEKSKLLDLLFTISNLCRITIYQADMPTVIGDALLSRGYQEENKVITKGFDKPSEKEKIEGAYVKEPIAGFYNWVAAFDFASLYPTTMRQFNISPESFVKKLEHGIPLHTWKGMSNEQRKNQYEKVAATIRNGYTDNSKIVCDNGVIFQKKDSTLKQILTDLYDQRKIYKKKMLNRKKQISDLENEIKLLEKEL